MPIERCWLQILPSLCRNRPPKPWLCVQREWVDTSNLALQASSEPHAKFWTAPKLWRALSVQTILEYTITCGLSHWVIFINTSLNNSSLSSSVVRYSPMIGCNSYELVGTQLLLQLPTIEIEQLALSMFVVAFRSTIFPSFRGLDNGANYTIRKFLS